MKYVFGIVVFLVLLNFQVFSQNDSTKVASNIIYAELCGAGGYGSVNYERVFFRKNQFMFSSRLGISTYHIYDYSNKLNPDLIIPVSFNACFGNNHKIEIGLGQTLSNIVQADFLNNTTKRSSNFHSFFNLAYRFQLKTKGIFFRLAYTPVLEYNREFRHWAGISIGYSF